jgi:hypothetical protein
MMDMEVSQKKGNFIEDARKASGLKGLEIRDWMIEGEFSEMNRTTRTSSLLIATLAFASFLAACGGESNGSGGNGGGGSGGDTSTTTSTSSSSSTTTTSSSTGGGGSGPELVELTTCLLPNGEDDCGAGTAFGPYLGEQGVNGPYYENGDWSVIRHVPEMGKLFHATGSYIPFVDQGFCGFVDTTTRFAVVGANDPVPDPNDPAVWDLSLDIPSADITSGGGDWLQDLTLDIPSGQHLVQVTQMNASADESDRICLLSFKAISGDTPFDGWWHYQPECDGPGPYSEPCGYNPLSSSPTPEDAASSHWGVTLTGYYE